MQKLNSMLKNKLLLSQLEKSKLNQLRGLQPQKILKNYYAQLGQLGSIWAKLKITDLRIKDYLIISK